MRRRFLTLLLFAGAVSFLTVSVLAGAITLYPPLPIDTSATYQPAGFMGARSHIGGMVVGQGDSLNLVLMSTAADGQNWWAVRTTPEGNLIDSLPQFLIDDSTIARRFCARQIDWRSPYFYVFGTWLQPSGIGRWAYIRVRTDLTRMDPAPVIIGGVYATNPSEYSLDQNDFWQIYRQSTSFSVRLNDLTSGSTLVNDLSLSGQGDYFPVTAATANGLMVASRTYSGSTLYNTLVRRNGSLIICDSVTYSDPGQKLFRSLTVLPYKGDSGLVCWLETATDSSKRLRYYFLDATGTSVTVIPHEITLPPMDLSWGVTHKFILIEDTLYAVTRASSGILDLFQFDLTTSQLIQSTRVSDSVATDYNHSGGVFNVDDQLHYYFLQPARTTLYGNNYTPKLLLISRTAPATPLASRFLLYEADHQCQPSLVADHHNISVYCQLATPEEYHLAQYSLNTPDGPLSGTRQDFLLGDSSGNPTVYSLSNRRVLLWDKRKPDTGNYYPVYENRVVLFDGDFPLESDLAQKYTLRQVSSFSYPSLRPLVAEIDSLLYVSHCTYFSGDYWGYNASHRLRALNINSNTLNPLAVGINVSGAAALLKLHDTAIWVAPFTFCTEHDNITCYVHYEDFSASYVVNGQIARQAGILDGDVWYYGPLYTGVAGTPGGAGHLLALSQVQQLWEFDTTANAFHARAGLYPYLDDLQECSLYPVETPNAHCVIAVPTDNRLMKLIVLDKTWQFVDSVTITPTGTPVEYSQFVYDSASNRLLFAYSSFVPDHFASNRIFLQSVKVDILTDTDDDNPTLPGTFTLSQNFPNPFNPSTTIKYDLPQRCHATLSIYNILGEKVAVIVDQMLTAGPHEVTWDGRDRRGQAVASGLYLYLLEAGNRQAVRKMVLLK